LGKEEVPMSTAAKAVAVKIVRFVMEHQPGIVEGEFMDADGSAHKVVDKCVMMTTEDLWSDSVYPQDGIFPCEVLSTWTDDRGRALAKIEICVRDEPEERLVTLTVLESAIRDYFS